MQLSKTTLVQRDKLYFDKFKYRLTFELQGSGWTEYRRNIDIYKTDLAIRQKENTNFIQRGNKIPWPNIDNIDLTAISKLIDYREKYHQRRQPATIAGIYSNGDGVRVFTNDLTIIYESFDIGGTNYLLTEVEKIEVPTGVMIFARKPKFKYRTYFKEKRVDQHWKDGFNNLLANNPEIVPCGSLAQLLKSVDTRYFSNWLSSGHFVEYNSESLHLVLDLFFDCKYLGKNYELRQKE
jgi:hypothetical protein